MSTFYSSIKGCRGEATRCGTFASGIRSSVQSYDGSIICNMDYSSDKKALLVRVGTSDRSSCYSNGPEFSGTFDEFNELLLLAKDIKEGKVVITRP